MPTNREANADAYATAKPSRVLVARCNTWDTQAIAPMCRSIDEVAYKPQTARATRAANRQAKGKTLDAAKGNGGRAPFSLIFPKPKTERSKAMTKTEKHIALAEIAIAALALVIMVANAIRACATADEVLARTEFVVAGGRR